MSSSGPIRYKAIIVILSLVLAAAMVIIPLGAKGSQAACGLKRYSASTAVGQSAAPGAADTTFADRFGVADPHLPLYPQYMDPALNGIRDAGGRWVRCGFAWPDMEYTQGAWNYAGSDMAVAKAEERGIKILGVLGFCPPWANGGHTYTYPPVPEHITDWENYVRTVCTRYKGRVAAWEIWNEENIANFWQPAHDSAAYMTLVSHTSPVIREVDPEATIVMGGMAGLGIDFIHECLDAGIDNYVDALAYHPYVETMNPGTVLPNESWCRYLVTLVRAYIKAYGSRPLQIWLTEVGWTTIPNAVSPGVDEDTQGCYLMRTFINYADTEVSRVIWHEIYDEGGLGYGLLRGDGTAKPSLSYYRVFQDVFGAATSSAPDAASYSCSAPETLEAHSFNLPGGGLAMALWKSDDVADTLSLTTNSTAYDKVVTVDPVTGAEQPTPNATRDPSGRVTVTGISVGKQPVILKFALPLTVTSISPKSGINVNIYSVAISGTNLLTASKVRLQRGTTVIDGTGVVLAEPGKLTCKVDLRSKPLGKYDVIVTNPDAEAKLVGGFTVVNVCGQGAGASISVLAGLLGLLSVAGLGWRRLRR
jgi:Glycosyl hydrolases family 39